MMTFVHFVSNHGVVFDRIKEILRKGEQELMRTPPNAHFGKSVIEARKLLYAGHQADFADKPVEALKYYCRSIATAPDPSEELAKAYSRRSELLYRFRQYEYSMLDVNRALALGRKLHFDARLELLSRKRRLLKRIAKNNSIKWHMSGEGDRLICALMNIQTLPATVLENRFFRVIDVRDDAKDLTFDPSVNDDFVWAKRSSNSVLPRVSPKVRIVCDEQWGRHWVATQDIDAGDILAMEDFFAVKTSSHRDYIWFNHCAYCTLWCEALIPCNNCAWEMYCSEKCREKAKASYHKIECRVITTLSGEDNLEDIMFALRVFLIGTKQGRALVELMNYPITYECLEGRRSCVGSPIRDDYLSILNLYWKVDYDKILTSVMNDTKISLVIGKVINQLRVMNFFGNAQDLQKGVFIDVEKFAALLLIHHLAMIPKYRISLTAEYLGEDKIQQPGRVQKEFGYGLASVHGLLNHSCDANAALLVNRRSILTYSLRPIKAGEQIFMAYLEFSKYLRTSRRNLLQRIYDFDCSCRACMEFWPIVDVLKLENFKFRSFYDLVNRDLITSYEKLLNLEKEKKPTICEFQQLELLRYTSLSQVVREFVVQPSAIIVYYEDFMKSCMSKRGNCYSLFSAKGLMKQFPDRVLDEILAKLSDL